MATKKVYLNTLAQVAGKVSTALISIFLIKIVTNYLDVAGYGLYSKIYNYLSIFAVIADLGLYTITVREISDNKDDREKVGKIVGNVLTMRTLFWVAIIVLSLGIWYFLPGYNSPMALAGILIAGVFTLFGLINSSVMSLLQAYLQTEFSFISTTAGKIVNFATIALIAFVLLPHAVMSGNPTLEFWGFVLIMCAGLLWNIVMTGLLYMYARRIEPIRFHLDPDYMKHMLRISLPYGLALFLNVIYFKVDVILLSILEPRAIADTNIALYSVPMKIVEVGMMFGTLFLNSMLPLFTEALKKWQNSKEERTELPIITMTDAEPIDETSTPPILQKGSQESETKENPELLSHISKAYRILLVFGVGIATFLFINGREIISLMARSEYVEHTKYAYTSLDAMQVVVFIFLFYFLSSLFTYLLIAHNEQKRLLRINTIITIANLLWNLALIPFYSFVGSAWVTLICQILLLAFTYHATRHIARFNFLPSFTILTLGFALLAGVANYALLAYFQWGLIVTLILSSIVFWVIYLGGIGAVFWKRMIQRA